MAGAPWRLWGILVAIWSLDSTDAFSRPWVSRRGWAPGVLGGDGGAGQRLILSADVTEQGEDAALSYDDLLLSMGGEEEDDDEVAVKDGEQARVHIVEAGGRSLAVEVPDDGLPKWVAWCAMPSHLREARSKLLEDHLAWHDEILLSSLHAQRHDPRGQPLPDESRSEEEKSAPRLLWEKTLVDPTFGMPEGMLVCGAAATFEAFRGLLESDPFSTRGLFDTVEFWQWNQVVHPDLCWECLPVPFALRCRDKPGMLETRKATREAHLDYLMSSQRVNAAGPLIPVDGDAPAGSLVLAFAESREALDEWTRNDPYAQAGIFEDVQVSQFNEMDITKLYRAVGGTVAQPVTLATMMRDAQSRTEVKKKDRKKTRRQSDAIFEDEAEAGEGAGVLGDRDKEEGATFSVEDTDVDASDEDDELAGESNVMTSGLGVDETVDGAVLEKDPDDLLGDFEDPDDGPSGDLVPGDLDDEQNDEGDDDQELVGLQEDLDGTAL